MPCTNASIEHFVGYILIKIVEIIRVNNIKPKVTKIFKCRNSFSEKKPES